MKGIGRINFDPRASLGTGISNTRELNNLARRAQAVDEPLIISGTGQKAGPALMFSESDGVYIQYPDGSQGLVSQYMGDHVDGQRYYPGQWVRRAGLAAMCIRTTTDSPELVPEGDAFWVSGLTHTGTPGWSNQQVTASIAYFGLEVNVPAEYAFQIRQYAWWIPSNATSQNYEVWAQQYDPTQDEWVTTQIVGEHSDTNVGWSALSRGDLWLPGERHRVWLGHISKSTPTSFQGYWQQKNENGAPSEGEANFYNNQTRIRFHYTDKNDVNRESQLRAVPVGAEMEAAGQTWTITSASFRGSDADFDVTPGGQRPSEDEYTYTFTYGAAAALDYVQIAGYYAGNLDLSGVRLIDGVETPDQNAYGVDVLLQQVVSSPDWEIFSLQ